MLYAPFRKLKFYSQGPGQPPGVDLNVTRIENDSAIKIKQSATKIPGGELPLRPGFGVMGKEILLWTNYFKFVSDGDLTLYRYSVEISPDGAGRATAGKKAKRVVQLLLEKHLQLYRNDVATDFRSTMISRNDIEIPAYLVYECRDRRR